MRLFFWIKAYSQLKCGWKNKLNLKFLSYRSTYRIFFLFIFLCFWTGCENPEDNGGNSDGDSNQNENTLDDDLSGNQANLSDELFFDFGSIFWSWFNK